MGERGFTIITSPDYSACPTCGNHSKFVARSAQVAEDCCEVWVECGVCGHDPTADNHSYRLEDVMGSLDRNTIIAAMDVRQERIESACTGQADSNE